MKENTTTQRVCIKRKAYIHPKVKVFKEGIMDVICSSKPGCDPCDQNISPCGGHLG